MEYRSNLAPPVIDASPARRPRPYRQQIRTLSYVNLDSANSGILRDLSEFGIAVQSVVPLTPNQYVHLRFELPNARLHIEAAGRVAWVDSFGQTGMEFVDLSHKSRRLLKEWIFTQLLTQMYLFSPCNSAPVADLRRGQGAGLLFSAAHRATIQIEQPATKLNPGLELPWFPVALSADFLSRAVDGLILLSSVLLFSVISLAVTNTLPWWPITLALVTASTGVFAAVYWFLFSFLIGLTPGQYLARLAGSETVSGNCPNEDDRARFR